MALPPAPQDRAQRLACPGQPRPLRQVLLPDLELGMGRRATAGVPTALGRAARGRLRRRAAPGADEPQPPRPLPAAPRRPHQPRPDRVLGGRLEPDPGPHLRRRRVGHRRAPLPQPGRPAGASRDGLQPPASRPLRRQPARERATQAGRARAPPRRRNGRRMGGGRAAAVRRRLQHPPRSQQLRLRRSRTRLRPAPAHPRRRDRPPPGPRARRRRGTGAASTRGSGGPRPDGGARIAPAADPALRPRPRIRTLRPPQPAQSDDHP